MRESRQAAVALLKHGVRVVHSRWHRVVALLGLLRAKSSVLCVISSRASRVYRAKLAKRCGMPSSSWSWTCGVNLFGLRLLWLGHCCFLFLCVASASTLLRCTGRLVWAVGPGEPRKSRSARRRTDSHCQKGARQLQKGVQAAEANLQGARCEAERTGRAHRANAAH